MSVNKTKVVLFHLSDFSSNWHSQIGKNFALVYFSGFYKMKN